MSLKESESIVLKRYNLAESDNIVVFFTKDFGIIRGVAKGVKRINSKFGSSLEPFSILNLIYFQKEDRELVNIQKTELIYSSFQNLANPENLSAFSRLSELLTSITPPNDPNEKIYRMLKACIKSVNLSENTLSPLVFYFEYWLLRLSGYLPDWRYCFECNNEFQPEQSAELDGTFNLRCQNCSAAKGIFTFNNEAFTWLNNVEKLPPESFIQFWTDERDESLNMLTAVLDRMLSLTLGKDITRTALRGL